MILKNAGDIKRRKLNQKVFMIFLSLFTLIAMVIHAMRLSLRTVGAKKGKIYQSKTQTQHKGQWIA